jgi:hypothetical protein
VVAVLGAREAGKTSLIASLFELLQCGRVGPFAFAGSDTLIAFERACHDARAACQRTAPYFERTKFNDAGLYHIAVCRSGEVVATDLLLADRAGEEYVSVADTPANARLFGEIRRADSVVVLVDGHRLVDVTARHNLKSELQLMLQALADNDAFSGRQRLAVVLTKFDEVLQSPHRVRSEVDFERFVEGVERELGTRFVEVRKHAVAASPATEVVKRGHGVAEVVVSWMLPVSPKSIEAPAPVPAARAFGRLTRADR